MRSLSTSRLVLLVSALAIAARLVPGPRTIDDAYITFRYARNLLAGHGPVYNIGEHVLGTTTPLYAALLALLGLLTGGEQAPFPVLAYGLNALVDGASCLLIVLIGDRLGSRRAGVFAAVVWAVAPMSVTFSIGGMETSLFITLTLATFYFHLYERPVAAAAVGALSLLTRPDAILFLGPLAFERVRRNLRSTRLNPNPSPPSLGEGIVFFTPLAAWTAFGFAYYGNPLPQSATAKIAAYYLPPLSGLIRLIQHYATPFFEYLTFSTRWVAVGIVLYPFLCGLGALRVLRQRVEAWPFFVYPWIYLAAFAIPNALIFRWYLAPPLPGLFLQIFLGSERLARDLRQRWLPFAFAGAALILTMRAWALHPDHGPDRLAPEMAFIKLELLYQDLGMRLRSHLPFEAVLAAGDIGALGYYSGAQMLDTIGLVSPEARVYYPLPRTYYAINYAVPPELIKDLQPDMLAVLEVYGRNALLIDPTFQETYRLIEAVPTDIYGSRGLLVFARKTEP